MKEEIKNKRLKKALYKKAVGYNAKEIVEEYSGEPGEVNLIKKKVTIKNVPPDTTAIKMLLDENGGDITEMTDEQLETEKQRLLDLLKNENIKEIKSEKETEN